MRGRWWLTWRLNQLLVRRCVECDVAENLRAQKGSTPLYVAAENAKVRLARLLLANKANVDLPNAVRPHLVIETCACVRARG